VALALLDINVSLHLKTMEVGEGWVDRGFLDGEIDGLLVGRNFEGVRVLEGVRGFQEVLEAKEGLRRNQRSNQRYKQELENQGELEKDPSQKKPN
jgi:hypothetical protein